MTGLTTVCRDAASQLKGSCGVYPAGSFSHGLGILLPDGPSVPSSALSYFPRLSSVTLDGRAGELVDSSSRGHRAASSKQAPCDLIFCFPRPPNKDIDDTFSVEHYHRFDTISSSVGDLEITIPSNHGRSQLPQVPGLNLTEDETVSVMSMPPTLLKRNSIALPLLDTLSLLPPPPFQYPHWHPLSSPSASPIDDPAPALLLLSDKLDCLGVSDGELA